MSSLFASNCELSNKGVPVNNDSLDEDQKLIFVVYSLTLQCHFPNLLAGSVAGAHESACNLLAIFVISFFSEWGFDATRRGKQERNELNDFGK